MQIRLVGLAPADELDRELEGAIDSTNEIVFVDAEQIGEQMNLRNRRFTHADDADFFGLDQRDIEAVTEHARERCGGHPARRTATDDDHFFDCG
jgi:hypothetical protein